MTRVRDRLCSIKPKIVLGITAKDNIGSVRVFVGLRNGNLRTVVSKNWWRQGSNPLLVPTLQTATIVEDFKD